MRPVTLFSRSLTITPYGLRFLILTLTIGVTALNTGNNLLYLILAMMLSLIIVSGILSEQSLKGIGVVRRLPSSIVAGEAVRVGLTVTNTKKYLPSFALSLEEIINGRPAGERVLFHEIPARQSLSKGYSHLFPARGRHRIEGVRITTRFPFGLFEKSRFSPCLNEVIVYPKMFPLSPRFLDGCLTGEEEIMNRKGKGITLYDLREYVMGDDARAIHWKTSARHSRLLVREYAQEEKKRVLLFLSNYFPQDADSTKVENFERGVSYVASIALVLLKRDFEVKVVTWGGEVSWGRGEAHLKRILHFLALLIPTIEKRDMPLLSEQGYRLLIMTWDDPFWRGREEEFSRTLKVWERTSS